VRRIRNGEKINNGVIKPKGATYVGDAGRIQVKTCIQSDAKNEVLIGGGRPNLHLWYKGVTVRKSQVFSGGRDKKAFLKKTSIHMLLLLRKNGGRGIEAGFIHDHHYFFESTRTRFPWWPPIRALTVSDHAYLTDQPG
jgi:hypothetical protein